MPRTPRPVIDRFNEKVQRSAGCWEWTAYRDPRTGYGKLSMGASKVEWAHRVSYEHFVGPIPAGLQIDHLCRNRGCVNPEHLEPVTLMENLLRGDRSHLGRRTREATVCPQGHPYDEANTWLSSDGRRYCRACNRDRMRARRAE